MSADKTVAVQETHEVPRMVRKAMAWFGLSDQDVAVLIQVMKNRMSDMRAFMLGGKLSDGIDIPGQRAVLESNLQLQKQVQELTAKVEQLLAKGGTQ